MLLKTFLVSICFATAYATNTSTATQDSCNGLYKIYPNATFFPGSERYAYENTYSWSASAWLRPACVFLPSTPSMVSTAVQLFSVRSVPFAIRGGGAMPIANAANIGGEEILISTSNFTKLSLSDDKQILSIEAGIRWPDVYNYLEPYNVAVIGGRIGNVGVIGYLLGGGIGFFSYEYGMASTGVDSFECVLANGTITTASSTENSDLFWALRGGGNSFCIVTSVKLRTISLASVQLGDVGYGSGPIVQKQYIQSMVDFAQYASQDPQSATEGQIRWDPSRSPNITFDAFIFNSGDSSSPMGLQNLTAPVLPFVSGNLTRQTLKTWANHYPSDIDLGNRKRFLFIAIPANTRAMEIAVDAYFEAVKELIDIRGFFTAFTVMPVTKKLVSASAANGGNPLGLNENTAPALWLVESPSWKDAVDDEIVMALHAKVNQEIAAKLEQVGLNQLPFFFLNDAETGDKVFQGYGQDSLQKLKNIRAKYDPEMVYTKLMPGGWKVEDA